ncbi:MAG: hypothetical protein JW702_08715 [Clostridiales bacterium]|nr:hypothetical protein [Clostridiales bacterium]
MKNTGYFLKETWRIFKSHTFTNILSIVSIGLILLMFSLIFMGWQFTSNIVEIVRNEAEIDVYLNNSDFENTRDSIANFPEVREIRIVEKEEAYAKMEKILGSESKVLTYFDENPFQSYLEIKMNLDEVNSLIDNIEKIENIDYIRDNRDILDRIDSISKVLSTLNHLIILAVGITTILIISHMIRQGIYQFKDKISTLNLLGAPPLFIVAPFILEGTLLTVFSGIISALASILIINMVFGNISGTLPFLPLPIKNEMIAMTIYLNMSISFILGILGSIFGLMTSKN